MARRRTRLAAPWQYATGTWPEGPYDGGDWEHTAAAVELAANLARAVRRRRLELQLSRAQVAARAGLSVQTVAAVEGGRTWPDLVTLTGLADGCETTVRALLDPARRAGRAAADDPSQYRHG